MHRGEVDMFSGSWHVWRATQKGAFDDGSLIQLIQGGLKRTTDLPEVPLMQELVDACAAQGFRQMIGYIDADNAASLALHEKFGFARVGLLPGVAYRYGRWCDTVMVQRSLAAGATASPAPISVFGR